MTGVSHDESTLRENERVFTGTKGRFSGTARTTLRDSAQSHDRGGTGERERSAGKDAREHGSSRPGVKSVLGRTVSTTVRVTKRGVRADPPSSPSRHGQDSASP